MSTGQAARQNYLTKQQAKAPGWSASEGNLWEVAEGMSIGGDRFGNREGCLPEVEGRVWYECDVNSRRRLPRRRASTIFQ